MPDLISVNNIDLEVLTYQEKRVITFDMMDRVHHRPDGTARKRFHENRKRFIEGQDFYQLDYEAAAVLRTSGIPVNSHGITLLKKRARDPVL